MLFSFALCRKYPCGGEFDVKAFSIEEYSSKTVEDGAVRNALRLHIIAHKEGATETYIRQAKCVGWTNVDRTGKLQMAE